MAPLSTTPARTARRHRTYHPAVGPSGRRNHGRCRRRAAATVVLLRDGRDGPEAYLQLRPLGMGFAGGLWVFPWRAGRRGRPRPGGRRSWAGPPPAWAGRMGLPVDQARGHVVAACRETLEEAGCCWPRRPPAPGSWPRPGGSCWPPRPASSGAGPAGGAAGHRPPALLGLVGDAGGGAAPLRHPLLRRRAAGRGRGHRPPGRGGARALAAGGPGRRRPGACRCSRRPGTPCATWPPSGRWGMAAAADRRVERILPVLDGAELVMPWRERYPSRCRSRRPVGRAGPGRPAGRPAGGP